MRTCAFIIWAEFLILLSACSQATVSPEMVQTAMAATQTAIAPAATSTPEISKEMSDYIHATDILSQKYEAASNDVQSFFERLNKDPALITNHEWKLGLAAALVKLQFMGDELGSIENVPQELKIADSWYKMVKSETQSFFDNITTGIDYMDPQKISTAHENAINISKYMNNARDEVRQLIP